MKTARGKGSPRPAAPLPPRQRPPIDPRAAVVAALVVIGVGLAAALLHSAPRASGHNNIIARDSLRELGPGAERFCQGSEQLPADTRAIRVSLSSDGAPGPSVRLRVTRGARVVTTGVLPRGWSGSSATVPVRHVVSAVQGARVCVATGPDAPTTLLGSSHAAVASVWTKGADPVDDRPVGERFRIDYLRADRQSWLAHLPTAARRLGLNAPLQGPWMALLAVALMLAATVLVARRLLGDLPAATRAVHASAPPEPEPESEPPAPTLAARARGRARRLPTAAWICALVAILNAVTWSVISPPFQFLDEQDHFAYVQQLAETGKPPVDHAFDYSQELSLALHDTRYLTVRESEANVPIWSSAERTRLDQDLSKRPSRTDSDAAGTATGQPPLSYALGAIPYRLASGGSVLDRLMLVRLLSALIAGVTALFVFLFVREALPRVPWAWTVAGLAAALQPLFGWASGSVNPDSLLFASSAALFYCIARAFRRGLSPRLSIGIGAALAAGLLTKFAFAGLVPGATLAVLVLGLRQATDRTPRALLHALRLPALTIAATLVPFLLVALLNVLAWDQPPLGVGSTVPGVVSQTSGDGASLSQAFTLIWQLYLPRLPGMTLYIQSPLPAKTIWLKDFVGSFGWRTVSPPNWLTTVAMFPALGALTLCGVAIASSGRELRRRLLELASYAAMIAGLLLVIGIAQYSGVAQHHSDWFGQGRYVLPLLAPFAAVLALAARGAGRRWAPTVGALIVMVVLMHDIYSQLLVVSAYYG